MLVAMHPEKYSLTWHTYSDYLKSMMKELMMNEDFSDVTLVTEDKKQIKANVNILSACSPVFKDILTKGKNTNQIMYLRGVQFSEMESILQFIHLGEATLCNGRMEEFLAVAKSLEIKELCNAQTETKSEPEDTPSSSDQLQSNEQLNEQSEISDNITKQKDIRGVFVCENGKFECEQCQKAYSSSAVTCIHKKSEHQGVKYACNKCDYKAKYQGYLIAHIQSIHEGVYRFVCNQCNYKAKYQSHLTGHIQSIHEGVRYACNQCDKQYRTQSDLKVHIQVKHEGVKYACNQCNYQATQKSHLGRHIKNAHED